MFAYIDPGEGSRMVQSFGMGAAVVLLAVIAVCLLLVLRRR